MPCRGERAAAKDSGNKRYFTGKPCRIGHIAERLTSNGSCMSCNNEKNDRFLAQRPGYMKVARRKHYVKNAVAIREDSRKRREADPKTFMLRTKRWINNNKDKNAATRRAWYAKKPKTIKRKINNEKNRQRVKNWRIKNPDKARVMVSNNKARRKGAPGRYVKSDITALFKSQNGVCVYCSALLIDGYHVDHIIPLARGGSNWPINLQLTCPLCNMSKGAKTHEEFIKVAA